MNDNDKAIIKELPPLPTPAHRGPDGTGSYFDSYTAEQYREGQLAAIAADRAQQAGAAAPSKAESIDTPEFRKRADAYHCAQQANLEDAYDALVAFVDADLRAQLAIERQAKEYEQRHAAESEVEVAKLSAQLARQGQGEPVAEAMYWKTAGASGWSFKWLGETPTDFTEIELYASPAQASAAPADVLEFERTSDFTVRIVFHTKAACDWFVSAGAAPEQSPAASKSNDRQVTVKQAGVAVPKPPKRWQDRREEYSAQEQPAADFLIEQEMKEWREWGSALLTASPSPAAPQQPDGSLANEGTSARAVEQPADDARDAARGKWLIEVGFKYANVDLACDRDGDLSVVFHPRFYIPEPVGMSYEDGEWTLKDIRTAIDAAIQSTKGATDGAVGGAE